jgi:hypothetical protein
VRYLVFLFLFITTIANSQLSEFSCHECTPITDNNLGSRTVMFTGVKVVRNGLITYLHKPLKISNKGTMFTIEDAYGGFLNVSTAKVKTYNTIAKLTEFLTECNCSSSEISDIDLNYSSDSLQIVIDGVSSNKIGLNKDHGGLSGLGDDDHSQYLLLSGRANQTVTGDLKYNDNISFGTATGTGKIRLPDSGTTASDGISFGASTQIFRSDANGSLRYNTGSSGSHSFRINNNIKFQVGDGLIDCPTPFSLYPNTLTGSQSTSALNISQTWNTTGNPTLIFANAGNTASGSASLLIDLQLGGISQFRVSKSGTAIANSFQTTSSIYSGPTFYRTNTNSTFAMYNDGNAASGVELYGSTHATRANEIVLKTNSLDRLTVLNNGNINVSNSINFGTTTGTGRINLPDAGTTASDGIFFGTGVTNLYRHSSTTIRTDGALQVLGAITNNNNNIVVSSNNIYNQNATGIEYGRYGGGGGLRLYPNNTVLGAELKVNGEFALTPPSLTGSSATSILNLTQTWNTTGSPTAINVDITNTASGASANFADFKIGGVSQFRITKSGIIRGTTSGTISSIDLGRPNTIAIQGGVSGGSSFSVELGGNTLNGNSGLVDIIGTFNPTSGSTTFTANRIRPTINQTGGANGITRGLFIDPTLTSAADYRGAEFVTPSNTVIIGRNTGSAAVDVQSTTQGFLPPRMTAAQASAISSPAEGLLVYVTDTNGTFTSKGWWGFEGTTWAKLNN